MLNNSLLEDTRYLTIYLELVLQHNKQIRKVKVLGTMYIMLNERKKKKITNKKQIILKV